MAKLSVSSGAISLNDLRSHFDDTNSISMSDFHSSGDKYVTGLNPSDISNTAYYSTTSGNEYFWRIVTTQNSTSANGGGTISTQPLSNQVFFGGYATDAGTTNFKTFSIPWRSSIYAHAGANGFKPNVGDADALYKRGTLQSAGSYSAWSNTVDFKGNITGSTRSKTDYYQVISVLGGTSLSAGSSNPTVPTSGAIDMADLYQYENGVVFEADITVGEYTGRRGYGNPQSNTTGYGSTSNTAVSQNYGLVQGQTGIFLDRVYIINESTTPHFQCFFRYNARNSAAGSISNTSTSNISRSRFGAAFNHTGYGYTDTTAVWMVPERSNHQPYQGFADSFNVYNYCWYDYRNQNFLSNAANSTRRDDGHAGWLLPTAGPSLLQVRGESENGNPFLSNVRFTPNSTYQGKTVIIQAVRTRNSGGITGFSCSGAASGNFSNLSSTLGIIERKIVLPSSGYIQFSATGSGSYSGTNRIVQINIYDPYIIEKDNNAFNKIYVGGTKVFDRSVQSGNTIIHTKTKLRGLSHDRLELTTTAGNLPSGFSFPSNGSTFTLKITT